jgi:hypothetical protein
VRHRRLEAERDWRAADVVRSRGDPTHLCERRLVCVILVVDLIEFVVFDRVGKALRDLVIVAEPERVDVGALVVALVIN